MKHPAKYIGKKPRKYTVPVPVKPDTPGPIGSRGPVGGPRTSGRVRGQGVEPIAAQAAAAAQVRTYRDNGLKHSSSAYNRVCSLPSTIRDQGLTKIRSREFVLTRQGLNSDFLFNGILSD